MVSDTFPAISSVTISNESALLEEKFPLITPSLSVTDIGWPFTRTFDVFTPLTASVALKLIIRFPASSAVDSVI